MGGSKEKGITKGVVNVLNWNLLTLKNQHGNTIILKIIF